MNPSQNGLFLLNNRESSFTIKGKAQQFIIVVRIFIAPERKRISKNGFRMCTRHILRISMNFSPKLRHALARRTVG